MREIKFRAWDEDEGWSLFELQDVLNCISFGDTSGLEIGDNVLERLGMFTGQKDKNGKEIYEGDVVRYDYDHIHPAWEVVWSYDGWTLKNREMYVGWNDDTETYTEIVWEKAEVIGNIYENSELLEDKHEKV